MLNVSKHPQVSSLEGLLLEFFLVMNLEAEIGRPYFMLDGWTNG